MRDPRGPELPIRPRRWMAVSAIAAAVCACAPAAEAAPRKPLNLYEWMAVAPIVVAGEVLSDDSKFLDVEVRATCRGPVVAGKRIQVDQRGANRDREPGTPALELKKGQSYLFLLAPPAEARAGRPFGYVLVRGTLGARSLPAEGADLWIEAAARLCRLLAANDDQLLWQELGEALSAENPVLVGTALEMHIKFLRGGLGLLPRLRDLMGDARADFRVQAAELAGQIVGRTDWRSDPSGEATVAELIGRARRDPEIDVRVSATRALGAISGARVTEALREIAQGDPEQAVRYAAERLLFERNDRERNAPPGSDRRSSD